MTGIGWNQGAPGAPGISDPGDTPVDAGGKDLVEESEAAGKHIVLGVRGFDSAQQMSSYLRLGSAPAAPPPGATAQQLAAFQAAERLRGDDLAFLVQGFADDTRDRKGSPPADDEVRYINPPGNPDPHVFAPPETLDPSSPGNQGSQYVDPRIRESAVLHTKGGWRDHTDGNRITTTRGDKVEVIRGNYRLVVLGRPSAERLLDTLAGDGVVPSLGRGQSPTFAIPNPAGIDMSGGLNDYGDLEGEKLVHGDPSASGDQDDIFQWAGLTVAYQWTKDSHGNMVWTQTTTRGHPGPWIIHGAPEIDSIPYPPVGFLQIVNNHYVDYEEDQLGSSACRVDHVEWSVYAHDMETLVDVSGTNSTMTTGSFIRNGADLDALVTVNDVHDMLEVDVAPVIGLAQFAIANLTAQVAAAQINVSGLVTADLHLGLHYDWHALAHVDVTIGQHCDVHLAMHLETHAGAHIETQVGEHFQWENDHVKLHAGDKVTIDGSGQVTVEAEAGHTIVSPTPRTVLNPTIIHRVAANHLII